MALMKPDGQKEGFRRRFNRLAVFYDFLVFVSFGRFIARSRVALLERLPKGGHVLIAGCGTGEFLASFLSHDSEARVVCVDISDAMLEKARLRVARKIPKNLERVRFVRGDIRDLEAGLGFDLVCTNYFLDVFAEESVVAIMQKLDGFLRAGGRWYLSDFTLAFSDGWRRCFFVAVERLLYWFFIAACRIEGRELYDYEKYFERLDLKFQCRRTFLGGFLFCAIYQKPAKVVDKAGF